MKNFPRQVYFLFGLLAILSGFATFWVDPDPVLTRDAGVQAWESRLEPLKHALPADLRVVGYLSDLDLLENPTESQIFTEIDEFPLTQYSLAPIRVEHGFAPAWIIANFTHPEMQAYLNAHLPIGFEIQSFGFGIYLIHRP